MNLKEFQQTLDGAMPEGLGLPLQALWQDAKGDWVHAYLHRKEGDESNARYWYGKVGKPFFNGDLKAEWEQLVSSLLLKK
ncbi:MAG: hypothetical protein PHD76_12185 [Methylacidiphilales bacterium]|nr:hypothetical protein [Candidatus Methylacidiphilales bacterium]